MRNKSLRLNCNIHGCLSIKSYDDSGPVMSVYQDERYCDVEGVNDINVEVFCIHGPAICTRTICQARGWVFIRSMRIGVACVAAIGTCWRTTVSIPAGVAITVPPTNGSVGFGRSAHGELRA